MCMHLYPPKDNYGRKMQVSLNPPQFFMHVCLFYAEFSTQSCRDSKKKQTVCNEQVSYIFTCSTTDKFANTLNKPP